MGLLNAAINEWSSQLTSLGAIFRCGIHRAVTSHDDDDDDNNDDNNNNNNNNNNDDDDDDMKSGSRARDISILFRVLSLQQHFNSIKALGWMGSKRAVASFPEGHTQQRPKP
eukprot:991398-Amphidinium_carterae.2